MKGTWIRIEARQKSDLQIVLELLQDAFGGAVCVTRAVRREGRFLGRMWVMQVKVEEGAAACQPR